MTRLLATRSVVTMEAAVIIKKFLAHCRRRLMVLEVLAGVSLIAGMLFAAIILSGLLMLIVEPFGWIRVVFLVVIVLIGGFCLYWYILRPGLVYRQETLLSREVERRLFSANQLELVSAVQLEGLLPQLEQEPNVSPALVRAHLNDVASELAGLNPKQVISARRLRPPMALSGLLLVSLVVFALLWPNSFASGMEFLFERQTQLASHVDSSEPPWVGDIQLNYQYPAYTGRSNRLVEGTDGSIVALPGTRVTINSRAERKIVKARVKLKDGTLPLAVRNDVFLVGDLVVMKPDRYWFDLEDAGGQSWTDQFGHPISLEVDRQPVVRLTKPAKDLVIQEQDALDLIYDAKDDFGLSEIRLVYRILGRASKEQRRVLSKNSKGTRKVSRRSYRWDLATLDLEAGDRVQFYIEATDNDTVLGPKAGRSATCNLKVFAAEEHHDELMQQAQLIWEKLLSGLGDVLDLEPQVAKQAGIDLADYRKIYKKTEAFLSETALLQNELYKDKLVFEPLVQAFENMRQRLNSLQRNLKAITDRSARGHDSPKIIESYLASHRTRRINRIERDVLYLEDLLDMVRLEELDRLAKDMARIRERLAKLMEKYAQARSEEVRRQIEDEIARLKEKIAKLLARQREVLKGIRDEYLNPDALKKMMSDRDMLGALDRIQKLMNEGKVEQAMVELEKLQQQLGQMQNALDQARSKYGAGKYDQLAQELAKTLGELNMITENQRKLHESTKQIRDRLYEKMKQKSMAQLKKKFAELRKKLEKVIEKITSIPEGQPDRFSARYRERALQQARLLDMSLDALNVAGSLEAADKLTGSAARLAREMEMAAKFEGQYDSRRRKKLAQYQKSSVEARAGSQEILDELRKFMPDPNKHLSKNDRKKLQQLGKQQDELKQKMRGLQMQMQKINEGAPIFGQDAMGRMRRGKSFMQRAAGSLGKKRPGRACPDQQGALSELEGLKDAMQKSCQKGSSGGMPMPMGSSRGHGHGRDMGGPGGNPLQRDVELPTPDDYEPPEAFRKALLEGMKDPIPHDFEQQVKRYYEELVK
ncbi:MAG: DUF4175 family protein [Deltaproteobacteria bacterium]|nr:DUF4175 family protein [Deltaproteobacteria bacterium]